ncbi:hypothetical protein QU487_06545 [Crenobacter sp. SG2305]|uniref:hypothetical protein n=1 Tax=Crenobacter oryzisoli TaxID=3056844 RepID=UPI0025AAA216|nr:hypothetical protein [Crenobacter sp. SG2305]MDN0082412.1 hypothetical protein [Crenobacter sp. SG2305]
MSKPYDNRKFSSTGKTSFLKPRSNPFLICACVIGVVMTFVAGWKALTSANDFILAVFYGCVSAFFAVATLKIILPEEQDD